MNYVRIIQPTFKQIIEREDGDTYTQTQEGERERKRDEREEKVGLTKAQISIRDQRDL